jgi:hypothetical protein
MPPQPTNFERNKYTSRATETAEENQELVKASSSKKAHKNSTQPKHSTRQKKLSKDCKINLDERIEATPRGG